MTTDPARRSKAVLLTALLVLTHALLVLLALDRADGAVLLEPGGTSYATEFIDADFWNLAWLLVPLTGVAAALWLPAGLVAAALSVVAHSVAATVTVRRYDAGGWSDGLEVLSYLWPLGHLVLGLVAVVVGGLIGRSRRRPGPVPVGAAGRR